MYCIYKEWSMNYVARCSLSFSLMFDFENPPHPWTMVGRVTFSSFSLIIFTVHYPLDRRVNPLSLSQILACVTEVYLLHNRVLEDIMRSIVTTVQCWEKRVVPRLL